MHPNEIFKASEERIDQLMDVSNFAAMLATAGGTPAQVSKILFESTELTVREGVLLGTMFSNVLTRGLDSLVQMVVLTARKVGPGWMNEENWGEVRDFIGPKNDAKHAAHVDKVGNLSLND